MKEIIPNSTHILQFENQNIFDVKFIAEDKKHAVQYILMFYYVWIIEKSFEMTNYSSINNFIAALKYQHVEYKKTGPVNDYIHLHGRSLEKRMINLIIS